jgi:hypothetical protein
VSQSSAPRNNCGIGDRSQCPSRFLSSQGPALKAPLSKRGLTLLDTCLVSSCHGKG